MTTSIALIEHVSKTGRLTVSLAVEAGDTGHRLLINGQAQDGRFRETGYGWLYMHYVDGQPETWGWPGSGSPDNIVRIQYRPHELEQVYQVGKPPSTFAGVKVTPQQVVQWAWDAGFRTEEQLLWVVSIARGEGGFYTMARNWIPGMAVDGKPVGFRAVSDAIGVEGPAAAWNRDHTQQGHSDRGLYQFNSYWFRHLTDATCDVPSLATAALKAHTDKSGWGSWGFGKGGSHYEQFFGELRPVVQAFLATT